MSEIMYLKPGTVASSQAPKAPFPQFLICPSKKKSWYLAWRLNLYPYYYHLQHLALLPFCHTYVKKSQL